MHDNERNLIPNDESHENNSGRHCTEEQVTTREEEREEPWKHGHGSVSEKVFHGRVAAWTEVKGYARDDGVLREHPWQKNCGDEPQENRNDDEQPWQNGHSGASGQDIQGSAAAEENHDGGGPRLTHHDNDDRVHDAEREPRKESQSVLVLEGVTEEAVANVAVRSRLRCTKWMDHNKCRRPWWCGGLEKDHV